jgi:hypothetical protein
MLVLLLCFVCSGLGSGLVSTPWQHYENHFLDASGNCGGLSGGLGGSFGGLEDTGYYSCAPPIPAAIPANKWFECGPADQAVPPIGRHKCTSPTEIAMSETSLLSGCQNSATGLGPVDFNFFQMYLQVASNAIFSNLTLNTNADDGYRVTIFNSDNLNGCYLPNLGSFQLAGVQSNFKPCIKNGEVNRVVFTQMDTCVVANSIGSAVFLADGVVIPSTLVFDPEATTTGAATTIASTVLSTAASTTLVATTVVPTSAVLSTTSVVPPLTTSSPTSTRPSTFRPSTVLPTTTASPALSSARLLFPELCPFPSVLDYCGFCSTGPPHVCECTSELQLMNACIMCDNNSTAINTGLRLCVPNDAGVTGLPGQYMIFDVEIELVIKTFDGCLPSNCFDRLCLPFRPFQTLRFQVSWIQLASFWTACATLVGRAIVRTPTNLSTFVACARVLRMPEQTALAHRLRWLRVCVFPVLPPRLRVGQFGFVIRWFLECTSWWKSDVATCKTSSRDFRAPCSLGFLELTRLVDLWRWIAFACLPLRRPLRHPLRP